MIDAAIVAAVPPDHPLASRTKSPSKSSPQYPLICLPRGTGIRAILDAAGVPQPGSRSRRRTPAMLAMLAARGLGVAILPEPTVGDLHPLALGLRGQIALCWRAGGPSSPAARALAG